MSDLPLPEPTPQEVLGNPLPGPLDIQHDTDPEQDHGIARHIPHIGNAILFFSLALTCITLCEAFVAVSFHVTTSAEAARHPLAGFVAECAAYVLCLTISWFLFPKLWQRSFLRGISWTARAARRHWWKLILLGFALSALAQLADAHLHGKEESDVSHLLKTPLSAWTLTLLGPTLAPLMEEIAFRGFLLPALATAYDWLSLDRTPAAIAKWQQSTAKSRPALVFGTVMSSIGFALIHSSQLHGAMGPVAVLFVTSLAFSCVYIRLRSVAASTLVHFAYNGLIFLELLYQSGAYRHLDKLN
jgi:membrane protease YdiL (CAAX protease family)